MSNYPITDILASNFFIDYPLCKKMINYSWKWEGEEISYSAFSGEMSNVGTSIKIPTYWPKSISTFQLIKYLQSKFCSWIILHAQHLMKLFMKMGRWRNLTSRFFYKEIPNVGTSLKIPTYWPKPISACQITNTLQS
jgi:hypothetical protein